MKRYVKASTGYASYKWVDEVLFDLFNTRYADYKSKETPWIDTEYGRLKYLAYKSMHDDLNHSIRILFDPSDFDINNFTKLCNVLNARDDTRVTVKDPVPRDGGYPQINIKIPRYQPWSDEDERAIADEIRELGDNMLPDHPPYRVFTEQNLGSIERLRFDIQFADPSGAFIHNLNEEYLRLRAAESSWCTQHIDEISRFMDAIPDAIYAKFPAVSKCKTKYIHGVDWSRTRGEVTISF